MTHAQSGDAAPLSGDERHVAADNYVHSTRRRRRGPRSLAALQTRSIRRQYIQNMCSSRYRAEDSRQASERQDSCLRSSPEVSGGESPEQSLQFNSLQSQPLNILCINIRSIIGKLGELRHVLRTLDVHLAMIQETWLDASTAELNVPGYAVISRKDRSESENRGGVLVLCRLDVKNVLFLFRFRMCGEIVASSAERHRHYIVYH